MTEEADHYTEGVAMFGMVLVLAGVAAGDGGMGTRAATEPVGYVPRLGVRWEGKGWIDGRPVSVWMSRETLSWSGDTYVVCSPRPSFHPDGRVGKGELTYKLEGERLTIRGRIRSRGERGMWITFQDCDCLFRLRPTAPKP